MRMLSALLISVLFPMLVLAEQPRLSKVIDAFKSDLYVVNATQKLEKLGYVSKDAAGAVVHGLWSDEGLDGSYAVSIYFEKGDRPSNREAEIVSGLVIVSAGKIREVHVLDGAKAAHGLRAASTGVPLPPSGIHPVYASPMLQAIRSGLKSAYSLTCNVEVDKSGQPVIERIPLRNNSGFLFSLKLTCLEHPANITVEGRIVGGNYNVTSFRMD